MRKLDIVAEEKERISRKKKMRRDSLIQLAPSARVAPLGRGTPVAFSPVILNLYAAEEKSTGQ